MITIKTAPNIEGYSVMEMSGGTPTVWVNVLWILNDGATVRTCDGYLKQGNTRCGDREVINAKISGDFWSSDSISPVDSPVPGMRTLNFGFESITGIWVDSRDFLSGKIFNIPVNAEGTQYFHLQYTGRNTKKVYYRGWTNNQPGDPSPSSRRWNVILSSTIYRRKLNDHGRVNDYGIYGFWSSSLSDYTASNVLYELSTGATIPDGWGDLDMRAVQGTRAININTLVYLKEMLELGKMVKSTMDSAISLYTGNWKNAIKEASSLYLSYHYGYKLSYQDTVELYNVARAEFNSVKRSRAASRESKHSTFVYPDATPLAGRKGRYDRSVKIWYRQFPQAIAQGINSMFRWDVFPELGNIYDLIPYSFVVDWFLPFGDILDIIDTHTYASTLDVLGVMRSEKLSCDDVPPTNSMVQSLVGECVPLGPISFSYYHRYWEEEISYPPLQLSFQSGPKNWLPAGAMILQRT